MVGPVPFFPPSRVNNCARCVKMFGINGFELSWCLWLAVRVCFYLFPLGCGGPSVYVGSKNSECRVVGRF